MAFKLVWISSFVAAKEWEQPPHQQDKKVGVAVTIIKHYLYALVSSPAWPCVGPLGLGGLAGVVMDDAI